MIKALAVDIDGTLTDMRRILCPAALLAMRRLNVPVILSTGNTHCFSRTVSVLLGTPRIFIAENGGVLSYSEDELEILANQQVCEDAFLKLSGEFDLKKYDSSRHKYRFTDVILQRDFDLEALVRRAEELRLPVDIVDTAFAVHIKDRSVNKGTGLIRIARHMNLDPAEFAAVGDSMSDKPMFERAGYRASVGNARPGLKEISDYVAQKDFGEGFAEIVDHMIREGMIYESR
mgnify:CR=1 FL=1